MLWYAVAYTTLLGPNVIARLLALAGFTIAFEVLIFTECCWYMLGLVTVLLLINTLRVLCPAEPPATSPTESFYSLEKDQKHMSFYSDISLVDRIDPSRDVPQLPVLPSTVESFYSYPASPLHGRSFHAQKATIDRRRQSSDGSVGLPIPPRSTHAPAKHATTLDTIRSVGTEDTARQVIQRRLSTDSVSSEGSNYPTMTAVSETFGQELDFGGVTSLPPLPSPTYLSNTVIGSVPSSYQRKMLAGQSQELKADIFE